MLLQSALLIFYFLMIEAIGSRSLSFFLSLSLSLYIYIFLPYLLFFAYRLDSLVCFFEFSFYSSLFPSWLCSFAPFSPLSMDFEFIYIYIYIAAGSSVFLISAAPMGVIFILV